MSAKRPSTDSASPHVVVLQHEAGNRILIGLSKTSYLTIPESMAQKPVIQKWFRSTTDTFENVESCADQLRNMIQDPAITRVYTSPWPLDQHAVGGKPAPKQTPPLDNHLAQIAQLQKEKADLSTSYQSAIANSQTKQVALDQITATLEREQTENKRLTDNVKHLTQQVQDLNDRIDALKTELAQARAHTLLTTRPPMMGPVQSSPTIEVELLTHTLNGPKATTDFKAAMSRLRNEDWEICHWDTQVIDKERTLTIYLERKQWKPAERLLPLADHAPLATGSNLPN